MSTRGHPAFLWLFVLVVAPVGAAVIIAVLLLFGVAPHTVFAPGAAVYRFLGAHGIHAPRAIGVLTTVGMCWVAIVAIGLAWEKIRS